MSLLFYAASMKNDNLINWVEMTFPLGGSATRTKVFLRHSGILTTMNTFTKRFQRNIVKLLSY